MLLVYQKLVSRRHLGKVSTFFLHFFFNVFSSFLCFAPPIVLRQLARLHVFFFLFLRILKSFFTTVFLYRRMVSSCMYISFHSDCFNSYSPVKKFVIKRVSFSFCLFVVFVTANTIVTIYIHYLTTHFFL